MNPIKFTSDTTPATQSTRKPYTLWLGGVILVIAAILAARLFMHKEEVSAVALTAKTKAKDFVDINEKQSSDLKIMPAALGQFTSKLSAYGSIDFNQNLTVQVFTPYQGKIIKTFADVGDSVKKGQILFSVDSSDLAQAEGVLLTAHGVFDQASATLVRAKELYASQSIPLKEYQQNISDQMAAEATLKAARESVRIFGKSSEEIAQIETTRKMDAVLAVVSPIDGQVITRSAQPGLLVQPSNTPAPFTVSDVSTKWLLINAPESDSPHLHVGQNLEIKVPALPDDSFTGKIKIIGATVDPNTRTVLVRAEVNDSKRILRSGMYATFVVLGDKVVTGLSVPENALVREGDGSMSIWVTTDGRHMMKRTVQLGLHSNGMVQVTQGLKEGEKIATTGAIFLSNALITNE